MFLDNHLRKLLSASWTLALVAQHAHLGGAVVADHVVARADREDRLVPERRVILATDKARKHGLLIEMAAFLAYWTGVWVLVVVLVVVRPAFERVRLGMWMAVVLLMVLLLLVLLVVVVVLLWSGRLLAATAFDLLLTARLVGTGGHGGEDESCGCTKIERGATIYRRA